MVAVLTSAALFTTTSAVPQDVGPTDGWPVATPESQGMDSAVLAEMLEHARERRLAVHSVVIIRHGRVVMDATFYPYDRGRPHDIASATKSVMSLLVGIAIDKGYVSRVTQPVRELLSLPPSVTFDSSKERISIEHLLTMTSGLNCGVEPGEKELAAMRRSEDWTTFALALPMRAEPGTQYAYCSCNNHLLSTILSARTGESALAFARTHLFAPLGIKDVIWPADPRGRSHGWGDLHLHPRDLAKIAYLYLHRGRWNGRQIVSEHWVDQSIAPRVSVRDGVGYGYSWWINTTRRPAVFEAVGRGGQRAAVVPDKDLVVVFAGGGVNTDDLAPFLFKAIQSDAPLAVNNRGAGRLRRALDEVRRPPPARVPDPLPPLARAISGARYVMEPNLLNLQHVSLTFSARSEARATLNIDHREWSLPIGLDGRYRFSSTGPEGPPIAARGHWSSPSEFLLDVDTVANVNHFTFHMRFLERRVEIQVDEATGEVQNLRVRGQAAATRARALAITHLNIVDVVDGRIVPDSMITMNGETITSVTQQKAPPAGARVVDGQGTFLIPGLWDMHAHIQGNGEAWLQLYLANGVTGIRDMGADLDPILSMREATASGRTLGPRIIAAGPILDDAPGDWPLRMRVKNAEQGRAAVQLLKRRGVDLIKVHNHTPRDAFFAIADEARRQTLPLAGHVPLKVTVQEGIDAGMTNIEHFSEDGKVWKACSGGAQYRPEACRPFFEMLARRRIWQTPTLVTLSELAVVGTPASTLNPAHLAYANRRLREMWAGNQSFFVTRPEVIGIFKNLAAVGMVVTRDMASAGVGILAGCDALIAGFCVHDELAAMVRAGMTPLAALQSATLNPARYLGREKALGSIATGKIADLVLLDGNPLEEIANVRRIRAVVSAGRLLDRRELDTLLARAKTAAQQ
jgi:CubicO group peptidase (beta-lactamase class C family)/imidazolonepropionase-like amidohydrolase